MTTLYLTCYTKNHSWY